MPRFLDVSRAPRDLRQKRRARVFRKRARREAWDIDGGGTGANDAGAIGRTGRGTAVLTGRRSHPPPEASARVEVRNGSRGSNSEKLRARCAERQEQWRQFRNSLDKVGVWQWRREYVNPLVAD